MKKLLIAILTGILAMPAQAQPEKNRSIVIGSRTLGKNFETGRDIIASEYTSKWNIFEVSVDSTTNMAVIMDRDSRRNGNWTNMGNIMAYHFDTNIMRWAMTIDYKNSLFARVNSMVLRTWELSAKSYGIDLASGADKWQNDIIFYYVDPAANIGLGYKFSGFVKTVENTMHGVDLATGKTLWTREIKRKFGWNSVLQADDNTILIASDGLHSVNIHTGEGWSRELKTGDMEHTGVSLEVLDNSTMSFATNFFVDVSKDFTRGLASNILVEGDLAYMSGVDRMICVDRNSGDVRWESQFPVNAQAGSSEIFVNGGNIYLVSKGYGIMGINKVNFGQAYFMGLDKSDGKILFRNDLGSSKGILDQVSMGADALYMLLGSSIAKYSLRDGSLIKETKIEGGANAVFAVGDYFTPNEDKTLYQPVSLGSVALFSPMSGLIILNDDLEISNKIREFAAYRHILSNRGYKFLNSSVNTVVTYDGAPVSEIKISDKAFITDNVLYDIQGNSLLRVYVSRITDY